METQNIHTSMETQSDMEDVFETYIETSRIHVTRKIHGKTYFYSMWYAINWSRYIHESVKDRKTWIHLEAYCQAIWQVQGHTSTNGSTILPCHATIKESDTSSNTDMRRQIPRIRNTDVLQNTKDISIRATRQLTCMWDADTSTSRNISDDRKIIRM